MSKKNKTKETKNIKVNKEEKVKKEIENKEPELTSEQLAQNQLEENLLNGYKNTLVLGEVGGKIPVWTNSISHYGCELFKRTLTGTEFLILQDSMRGLSSFLGAVSERITQISKEQEAKKSDKKEK